MITVGALIFEYFGLCLSMILFFCLCADLVLMIKYPFKDKQARMKKYLTVSFGLSIIVGLATAHVFSKDTTKTWPFLFFIVGYISIFIVSISSTLFAYKKLSKPGISGEIRNCILKRHVLAIVLYLVLNFYILISSVYDLNPDPINSPKWAYVFKILFFAQGIIMPLMRCTEQAFVVLIKKRIK